MNMRRRITNGTRFHAFPTQTISISTYLRRKNLREASVLLELECPTEEELLVFLKQEGYGWVSRN